MDTEGEEYTPIDVGLTMKSMNVVHKIRKQTHLSEEQRKIRTLKNQSSVEAIKVEAPPILDSSLPRIKEAPSYSNLKIMSKVRSNEEIVYD
jgi:hypothetical protein